MTHRRCLTAVKLAGAGTLLALTVGSLSGGLVTGTPSAVAKTRAGATTTLLPRSSTTQPHTSTTKPAPSSTTVAPTTTPVTTAPAQVTTPFFPTVTTSTSTTTTTTIAAIGGHIPVSPSTLPLTTKGSSAHVDPIFAMLSGIGFFVALVIMGTRFVITRPRRAS